MSEKELIEACQRGDDRAEKELYLKYVGRLFSVCLRYTGNYDTALDYTHDAMVKVFMSISRYQYLGEGAFYRWLHRLTINMIIDRMRKHKGIHLVPIESVSEPSYEERDEVLSNLEPEILMQMISRMPENQRIVFNLFCFEGFSHKEIAGRLGITEKGSASILAKARYYLRKEINTYINRE